MTPQEKRLRMGLCPRCGADREGFPKRHCALCHLKIQARQNERVRERVESGLCSTCKGPRGDSRSNWNCEPCQDRANANRAGRKRRAIPRDTVIAKIRKLMTDHRITAAEITEVKPI